MNKPRLLSFVIVLLLFLLPFYWFRTGDMDLGSDTTRLYYFNPVAYIQNVAMSPVSYTGFGHEIVGYYGLAFSLVLLLLHKFISSPSLWIACIHGANLSMGFLFVTLSVYEILRRVLKEKIDDYVYFSGILAGLVYTLSPAQLVGWDRPIITQTSFFINPISFYLALRFVQSGKFSYIASFLVLSVSFAHNFSWAGAPGFFSFFPLATVFIMIYQKIVYGRFMYWKQLFIGFFLFLGLHAFHLLPSIYSLLSPNSSLNDTLFTPKGRIDWGLKFFLSIISSVRVSDALLLLRQSSVTTIMEYLTIFVPVTTAYSFMIVFKENKYKSLIKVHLLFGIFFILTLYLVSANITPWGAELYKQLFMIPGFQMFRAFYEQWKLTYVFYTSLLFGISLYMIFQKKSIVWLKRAGAICIFILFVNAGAFIRGDMSNNMPLWEYPNTRIGIKLDPNFLKAIDEVKKLSSGVRVLTLPLADWEYQVILGPNSGLYGSTSFVSIIGGKQDFAGLYQFGEFQILLTSYILNKQYDDLKRLFGFLNIRYVFFNRDPALYKIIDGFPFHEMKKIIPHNSDSYQEFVDALGLEKIYQAGNFQIYEMKNDYVFPRVYVSDRVLDTPTSNEQWQTQLLTPKKQITTSKPVFIESQTSLLTDNLHVPDIISFERINQTKYIVSVKGAIKPYMLVLLQEYNPHWRVYLEERDGVQKHKNIFGFVDSGPFETLGKKDVTNVHMKANAHANAWLISSDNVDNKTEYTLIIEHVVQRYFYIGILISIATLLLWGAITLVAVII